MNTSLRTLCVAAVLAATTSFADAGSRQIIDGTFVTDNGAAGPSLPTTASLLAHVTTNGTTKPPGHALDGRLGTSPALDQASRRLGGLVRMAICTGC